jgi:hypothetical protein
MMASLSITRDRQPRVSSFSAELSVASQPADRPSSVEANRAACRVDLSLRGHDRKRCGSSFSSAGYGLLQAVRAGVLLQKCGVIERGSSRSFQEAALTDKTKIPHRIDFGESDWLLHERAFRVPSPRSFRPHFKWRRC